MKRIFAFVLLVCLMCGSTANVTARGQRTRAGAQRRGTTHTLAGLRTYVAGVLARLPVTPGLAVAVVEGDRVIFAEGFGYRDVARRLPVTAHTQFYIASTTKSFTATTAKLLAAEGKIDLDVPVKTYLPELKLPPPLAPEQISLRDLLTHRHGIGNEALEFRTATTGQYDETEIFRLLREHTRVIPPTFNYSNVGYLVASYAMQRATGETWQQIVQHKLLDPLSLNATTCSASKVRASADYALPYLAEGGTFIELPYKQDNTMHAAGGMASSAEDLARWLIVNMNGGRLDGRQVIPTTVLEETLAPQIDQKRTFYKFDRYAYSLGWNIATYEGDKLVHCFGTYEGFRPHISFMPEHRLGVVVLANESRDALFLPDLIAADIYDHLLRGAPLRVEGNTKVTEFAASWKKSQDARAQRAATRAKRRDPSTRPTLALNAYAGTYENSAFGQVVITAEGDSLRARFGNLSAPLMHIARDEFEGAFFAGETGTGPLVFQVDREAGVGGVKMLGQAFSRVK